MRNGGNLELEEAGKEGRGGGGRGLEMQEVTVGVKKSRQTPEKLQDLSNRVRGTMMPKEETIGRDWRQFRSSG